MWFIVSTEACERFSFYGMTSILTLYLQNRLALGEDGAKERVHLFNAAVYFLPLLGGWLADKYLGRYRTILGLSLFYCLGHGALALFEGKECGVYAGLALIALGAGGIKPCVSAFVADQFGALDERGLAKVYGIFYWAVNLGAASAFAIIPAVAQNKHLGYRWAFGIPGIFMAIAALVYWLGTPLYVKRPPQIQSDAAIDPRQRVQDRKTLLRIVLVLSPIVIFWALYYQLNTSWVQQGEKMQPYYLFGGANDVGSYTIDSQSIQSASAILVLILVPVMGIWGYPFLDRIGLPTTMTAKMTMGTLAIAASFCIVGRFQDQIDSGSKLSILWQLAAYFPLEIGEVMVSVTGLEFAYATAPARMKSVVMGVWFCITASGNSLVALITWLNQKFIHMNAAQQFYFYAVLMLCGACVFLLIARLLIRDVAAVGESPASPDSG
jgi:POT family proton-dependent oligopeptide transporter